MKIDNLYILNLDRLYKSCCMRQEMLEKNKTNNSNFHKGLINLYNHVEFTFTLSEVSVYEYMLLKRFSTTCSKLNNKSILYNSPDYNSDIYEYAKLIHEITHDNEIVNTPIKYNYPFLYGPSFLVKGSCAVTLSGRELINICDIDPSDFFTKATKGKCFIKLPSVEFDRELDLSEGSEIRISIDSYIKDRFIRSFYNNYFIQSTTSSDIVSDGAIYYYFDSHDEQIKIKSISNPIFKYDIETENLLDKTNYISELKNKANNYGDYIGRKNVIDNTYVIFNLYTRFSTYIDLFEKLPKEFFISYEDLKIPANFKEIYIPIEFHDKYRDKLELVYTKLINYIENEHNNFYVKYQCTFLNSMYAYSIKIKLDDINKYINLIDRTKVLPETKEIINKIIKFGGAVLKMF